jgi:hypothetical protein
VAGAIIVIENKGDVAAAASGIGIEDESKTNAMTPSRAPLAVSFEYQERMYFRVNKRFGVYKYIYLERGIHDSLDIPTYPKEARTEPIQIYLLPALLTDS